VTCSDRCKPRYAPGTARLSLYQREGRLDAQSPTDHAAILQIYRVPPAGFEPAPGGGSTARERLSEQSKRPILVVDESVLLA
jgi:hypothetical protein